MNVRVLALLLCGWLAAAENTPSSPNQTAKTSSTKPSSVSPTPVKPTPVKPTPVKKAPAKPTRKAAAPPRQMQPTPERYREIQQALVDKGFLEGPATGQWDAKSIDALKRFERSQNLEEDGKVDSLSLIALGLGPKRQSPPKPNTP